MTRRPLHEILPDGRRGYYPAAQHRRTVNLVHGGQGRIAAELWRCANDMLIGMGIGLVGAVAWVVGMIL